MDSQERINLKSFVEKKIMLSEDFRRVIGIDKSSFLDESLVPPKGSELTYDRFFPYKYFKGLKDEEETNMFVSISFSKNPNSTETRSGKIEFVVITHKNLMKTDYNMTRIDYISVLIDKMFNRITNDNIINKIQFKSDGDIIINTSFIGYTVTYSFDSFNTSVVKSFVEQSE